VSFINCQEVASGFAVREIRDSIAVFRHKSRESAFLSDLRIGVVPQIEYLPIKVWNSEVFVFDETKVSEQLQNYLGFAVMLIRRHPVR